MELGVVRAALFALGPVDKALLDVEAHVALRHPGLLAELGKAELHNRHYMRQSSCCIVTFASCLTGRHSAAPLSHTVRHATRNLSLTIVHGSARMQISNLFDRLAAELEQQGSDAAAIGIDLGTTKSCLATARLASGRIECDCHRMDEPGVPPGSIALPSVVAVDDSDCWVGHAARRRYRTRGFQPSRGVFAESKNDMGLKLSYHRAPEGYRSPTDIAARILEELVLRADLSDEPLASPVVITVPASFHGAQRNATLQAAQQALGDSVEAVLLDEPYAAMLDLLHRCPDALGEGLRPGANCLVFDFGGGTCDVAIFTLGQDADGTVMPQLKATSRYHRIGGGDIDRAIVHEHLLPKLLDLHGLKRSEVSFEIKRRELEPQLLPIAEQLKLSLCRQLARCGADASGVEAVAAGDHRITLAERELYFSDPVLDQESFEDLLWAFLDPNLGMTESDEYVERETVFAPIFQALGKSGLEPDDIDAVLLAGSSSLIPHVGRVLAAKFSQARLVSLGNETELQGAIARGAALQALSLAQLGQPLIAPVCSTEIALRTRQGLFALASAGDALPLEDAGPYFLSVPQDSPSRPLDLAIEVMADGKRVVGRSVWQLPAPVRAGESLLLSVSIDANQCVALSIERLEGDDEELFEAAFDAPISHIDQGQVARCRLLEAEESVRADQVPRAQLGATFEQMACDAATIGHFERALHFVNCAVQESGPTFRLLNRRGLYLEQIGDFERARECLLQAGEWAPASFNLALFLHRRKRDAEALVAVERSLERGSDPAYGVLKADILAALGREPEARLQYQDSVGKVAYPTRLDEWSLGWLARAATKLGRDELATKLRAEIAERAQPDDVIRLSGALLPDIDEFEDVAGRAA